MSVQHGYAAVGALQMYYEVHGEARPDRAPLLLVHGGGSTIGSNFGALIPQLAGTRQVIGVEEQGHGHTPAIDRPFTLENSADDIAAVLEQLAIPRADVLGFSAGGHIAMRLAMRHPRGSAGRSWPRRSTGETGWWTGSGTASSTPRSRRCPRSTSGSTAS